MAKDTFSLNNKGAGAHNPLIPQNQVLADAATVSPQAEQQYARNGTLFMRKDPDGSLINVIFDAERSIPGVLRITRKLYG